MARRRERQRISVEVDGGLAELVPDPDRPRAYTLMIDGTQQSHVDLEDPTRLEFEYIRHMAAAVDLAAPRGQALRALHLGGGALTLPRYIATVRPESVQRVIEVDAGLVELVRRHLKWPARYKIKLRVADAREALTTMRQDSYDLVIGDVFVGARTPAHLATVEYVSEVARVLQPGGTYVVNIADGHVLAYSRQQVATIREVFRHVCLIAEAKVLRGRRFGNVVLVASDAELPLAGLTRRAAGDSFPARLLDGDSLDAFVGGAQPMVDRTAQPSSEPPCDFFDVTA